MQGSSLCITMSLLNLKKLGKLISWLGGVRCDILFHLYLSDGEIKFSLKQLPQLWNGQSNAHLGCRASHLRRKTKICVHKPHYTYPQVDIFQKCLNVKLLSKRNYQNEMICKIWKLLKAENSIHNINKQTYSISIQLLLEIDSCHGNCHQFHTSSILVFALNFQII